MHRSITRERKNEWRATSSLHHNPLTRFSFNFLVHSHGAGCEKVGGAAELSAGFGESILLSLDHHCRAALYIQRKLQLLTRARALPFSVFFKFEYVQEKNSDLFRRGRKKRIMCFNLCGLTLHVDFIATERVAICLSFTTSALILRALRRGLLRRQTQHPQHSPPLNTNFLDTVKKSETHATFLTCL